MSELRKPDFSVFKARVAPYDFLLIHAIPGAEVHFSESGEDIVLQRLFAGRRNGFFVDIGAFRPIRYSNTYIFKALYGWRGINVDLSKQAIKEFDSRRPTDINVRAAVGKPGTRRTIWYFSEPALNTMSPANLRRQSVRGIEPVSVDTVEVVALAELLDRYMPSGTNIDLLNIDVEGLDLEVLQTNDWKKYRPKVVAIEDYDLLPKAQSVIYEYLTDQGYALFSHVFDTSLYIQRGLRTAPKERRAAAIPAVERLQEAVPGIEERTYVLARSHPRMRLDEGDGCDSRSAGAGQSHSAGVMAEKGGQIEVGDESKVVTLSRGETDGRRTDEVEAQTRVAGVEDKLRQAKLDNVERQEASLSLAEENERYRIVIQDLTTRLQASERRVVNLEERLSHQWQQLTQLESKCEELSVDLGIGGSGPGMHDVLEAFGVRYQELKHQYDQAEVSLSALHAQLFRFDVRIRSLIEELAQAQERSIRFQKERDKLRDERDSLRAALHASKQVCDRKLASVRKRLAKAEADLNVTEDRIRRLLSSKTWRYTESIRALYGACRRAFMKTRWLWDESSSSQRRA